MPDLRLDPREYCAPPAASFWDWNCVDDTLEWKEIRSTIAFRPELEQVLRALACGGTGLPSLSLVLLVLAACRDSWQESFTSQPRLFFIARCWGLTAEDIGRLTDGLNRISRFDPELRHPIEAKIHLLQFLFEAGGAGLVGEQALTVCDILLTRQVSWSGRYGQLRASVKDLRDGLTYLLDALQRLDEQALRSRRATGLDELVRPAEIPAEDWKQARALVSALLDDQELGGIARLARALMAVVHLPRPLCQPEELPMGGFSDIENRGSLDRLLISELAHDDLTLAVRIALNEALYLRREAPPTTPSLARSILIDVGIRMWGIPRVFATSAALALLATTGHHTVATVYRAQGTQIDKADLATRKGLTEHLGCLTPDAHPGRSLAPFFTALSERPGRTDAIVVTSEEAAADAEFQRCVARQHVDSFFLATVNRDGDFRLFRQSAHGRKVICEAKLVLDDLLTQRTSRSLSLIDPDKGTRLPAIFYEDPFPLLIPCNHFSYRHRWTVPGCGVFEIARDQRLLWWDSPARGPQQILDQVPSKGFVCWADTHIRAHEWIAVLDQPGHQYQLLTVDFENRRGKLTQLELDHSSAKPPYTFCTQEDGLLAISNEHAVLLSRSGQLVTRISTQRELSIDKNPLQHRRGRCFVDETSGVWYALTVNSLNASCHWQKLFDPQRNPHVTVVTMFDWVGHEGPVGITRQGQLYFPEDEHLADLSGSVRGPIEVLDVSPCGEWVLIEQCQGCPRNRHFVNLSSGDRHSTLVSRNARQMATARWVQKIPGHLHRHFSAAGRDARGQLTLVSTRNQLWTIELSNNELRLQPRARHTWEPWPKVQPLRQRVSLPNARFRLDFATWRDGSQIFLDSRGLLHLRSSDHTIPEATLVLADGAVAGWSADGRTWGNQYYTGSGTNAVPRDICAELLQPFVERLTQ